jgi:hypothetical protein
MNERGKSDGPVVPAKPSNNAARAVAETVEGRGPAEGNTASKTRPGHSAGVSAPSALDRVRESHSKTRKRGSRRCCITSTSIACGRHIGR